MWSKGLILASLALIWTSWIVDATSPALEGPVRLSYLLLLACAVVLVPSGSISRQQLHIAGFFLLANVVWMMGGLLGQVDLNRLFVDLAIISGFAATVANSKQVSAFVEAHSDLVVRGSVVAMSLTALVAMTSSGGGRGELPVTMVLAAGTVLLAERRYVLGSMGFGLYLALALMSGFRSSVLLAVVAIVLLGAKRFGAARTAERSIILLMVVPMMVLVGNLADLAFSEEAAASSRAIQFSSSGTNAAASDAARLAELSSIFDTLGSGDAVDIALGRGHGSSVLGEEFERRTAHNVWLTFIVRYGALGFVGVGYVHVVIFRRVISFVRGSTRVWASFLTIGALLVLLNGYLRFSIAEGSELFVLAVAIGEGVDRAR